MSDTVIWPTLRYDDAHAAIRFLIDAFGFEQVAVYENGDLVDHAELRWPGGGGIMLGSAARSDSSIADLPAGNGSVYIVTDEPDALFKRASAAGATVVMGLRDEDYGSRGFTVRDPEGIYWSFGTYGGAGSG
jgi:uncharacterized glyoxalase superfamily protein PhnB